MIANRPNPFQRDRSLVFRSALAGLLLWFGAGPLAQAAEQAGGTQNFKSLDTRIQELKQDVLDLNRDLFVLEEELLFPASTQLAVFLSVDVGTFFALDSVELKIDNKTVTHYLYTERENAALRRGGVHRLYLGNLRSGKHELVAFFPARARTTATIVSAPRCSSTRIPTRASSSSRSVTRNRSSSRNSK